MRLLAFLALMAVIVKLTEGRYRYRYRIDTRFDCAEAERMADAILMNSGYITTPVASLRLFRTEWRSCHALPYPHDMRMADLIDLRAPRSESDPFRDCAEGL